jgi:glycosyltransferase involved in cell wall biosynthesis
MELTVCVCVRDGAPYVDRCLQALLAETAPYGTPIVVVDHDSRDRTPQLLARWAGEQPDRLRVVHFAGEGLGAARDFAWRQSRTAWVAFIDIDCAVQPGWARAVHAALQHHAPDARCAAVGGTNRVAQDGRLLYQACAVLLATYVGGHDSILNRTITEQRQISHCPTLNVVYRRAALEAIAGFDPAYTRVSEDVDVSRRLLRHGYSLWANPGMVVDHVARPTLRSWARNVFLYGRGRAFHLKRQPQDLQLKFLAPAAVVLVYLAAALVGLCNGGGLAWPALVAAAHWSGIAVLLVGEVRRQQADVRVWLAAVGVVWITHLAYGAGFLFELPWRRDKFVP